MSQEAFYYQVQMEEEYMSKLKAFAEELRSEFVASDQEYCCYCGNEKEQEQCCGENHFVTFADLFEDVQNVILDAEIKQYERATK
jgi:hypothetical protein